MTSDLDYVVEINLNELHTEQDKAREAKAHEIHVPEKVDECQNDARSEMVIARPDATSTDEQAAKPRPDRSRCLIKSDLSPWFEDREQTTSDAPDEPEWGSSCENRDLRHGREILERIKAVAVIERRRDVSRGQALAS